MTAETQDRPDRAETRYAGTLGQQGGATVNRVVLVGTVGSDPDYRREHTPGGLDAAYLSLATLRHFERDGERQERHDWHRLTFVGRGARGVRDHVRKGTRLYVEGHLEYGMFERDGIAIPTVDVVVSDFVILGQPEGKEGGAR